MLNACIRCSTIFVGLVSLIQAVLWAGLSIWFIAVYTCNAPPILFQTDVTNEPRDLSASYLFYVSYVRGECRNSAFKYVAPSAERTYKYMLAYSIISSIWIPTIILLLVGTCLGARGIKAKWIYSPYIILTITCCVLDVVATAFYAIDITKTMTVEKYFNFLDMSNEAATELHLTPLTKPYLSGKTVIPAIVMTIIVSRCIVLWLLNLFFVAFGLQGLCAFKKPEKPKPYHQSQQFITDQQNQEPKQSDVGWIPFTKPSNQSANNHSLYPNLNDPCIYDTLPREPMNQVDSSMGRVNPAYVIDEPMRLDPVEVEVKQERVNTLREERYAEVAEIEMEPTPQEIRHEPPKTVQFESEDLIDYEDTREHSDFNSKLIKLEKLGLIVPTTKPKEARSKEHFAELEEIEEIKGESEKPDNILRAFSHVSMAESVLEDKDDVLEDVESIPATSSPVPSPSVSRADSRASNGTPKRIYDVHGNPTEERLTPKIKRIQKIIEKQMAARQGDLSGLNNNRPYSYVQPNQPQLDSLPKKNATVRGLEKPPIPVPDYSVRINKTPSFRPPLHNSD